MLQITEVTGQVGDRQIILTKCNKAEDCMSTIELRSSDSNTEFASALYETFGVPYDRIIYKSGVN